MAMTLFDETVPILVESAIVITFGLVVMVIAASNFQQRD